VWDPNSAKPAKSMELLFGDIYSVNITRGISSPTNLLPVACAPDFNFNIQYFQTNNVVQFQACTNVDVTGQLYQKTTVFVTNSTAAALAIIPPANCHTNGGNAKLFNFVTNLTVCVFEQYGQKWTNMTCTPLY